MVKLNGPRCRVSGKEYWPTREDAKRVAVWYRRKYGGRGKVYRCQFGEHYEITRSFMGSHRRKGGK